ncbi:conserved hypothetical protein [Aduncisulcus paluster]|uniref:Uncharacterized protein n=1 Tax=Aduncisulcus paluster TaxID=2918883 RepID=A0ABQ5K0V1_9EUKA|nr:conserved hypothetical protein [Aduncisulcus paluster]
MSQKKALKSLFKEEEEELKKYKAEVAELKSIATNEVTCLSHSLAKSLSSSVGDVETKQTIIKRQLKHITDQAAFLAKQAEQWRSMVDRLSTAIRETGDVENIMGLNNWSESDGIFVTWGANRDNLNVSYDDYNESGLNSFRTSEDWSISLVSSDSFVLIVDGVKYTDPKLFEGDSYLSTEGQWVTEYTTYNGSALPFSLIVEIILVPQQPFYIVKYNVSNAGEISLVSFVTSQRADDIVESTHKSSNDDSNYHYGWYDSTASGFYMVDGTKVSNGFFFATKGLDVPNADFMIGERGTSSDPISYFENNGTLVGSSDDPCDAYTCTIALQFNGTGSMETSVMRTGAREYDDCVGFGDIATSNSIDYWVSSMNSLVDTFLHETVSIRPDFNSVPMDLVTVDPRPISEWEQLFDTSLLMLKHSQVPDLGTFLASFHPAYSHKVWARDACFSSIICDSVGLYDEAEKFLTWMTNATPRDDGTYHTCYNGWTGDVEWFVEPQYDPVGVYMLAMHYHGVHAPNGKSFVSQRAMSLRRSALETLLLNPAGPDGSFSIGSDYSIWEESSDPVTGAALPTGFFGFSQSMAFSGLVAAGRMRERFDSDVTTSNILYDRATELHDSIPNRLWTSDGYVGRQEWSDTHSVQEVVDAATAGSVWGGLLSAYSSYSYSGQEIEDDDLQAKRTSHLNAITSRLTHDNYGLARYEGDVYFYTGVFSPAGQEATMDEVSWGVVTMFTAWAELLECGVDQSMECDVIWERLNWMVRRSAYGCMAVGEGVDSGDDNLFIMSSAPDIYEHAGVYIITLLAGMGLADVPRPMNY